MYTNTAYAGIWRRLWALMIVAKGLVAFLINARIIVTLFLIVEK